jgi:hypothetical protein
MTIDPYYLALSLAMDNRSVYPKSIFGGENAYNERTPYMEGWNAAVTDFSKQVTQISAILGKNPRIADLVEREQLSITFDNKECTSYTMYVNCNDLFYWACADAEEITTEEFDSLEECLAINERYGSLLWCCRKRGMRPQTPYYRCFPEDMKPLFDACGPARDD